ncbi:MarR family winged helix-turn-helix transcriptional regulator [Methylobacterium tarhaniae]|uniref:MarR family winged helix-turn-helix transcriptional regulator n=1 Tax=Methylobacterium tarhaniae TaxID=1187852 RepID=UPI001FDA1E97|nr:MarR family transcriptional regulator [Methylobacterium tarhaniae]
MAEFSDALAADYARCGIDIPEWRGPATLGMHDEAGSANDVVRCTRTHKSRISRAVSHLAELGFVERQDSHDDRREIMMQVTSRGKEACRELRPILHPVDLPTIDTRQAIPGGKGQGGGIALGRGEVAAERGGARAG